MTTLELMARSTTIGGVHRTLAEHSYALLIRIAGLDVDTSATTVLAIRVREAREILEAMKEAKKS